jgi:protein required for attachment to host cells
MYFTNYIVYIQKNIAVLVFDTAKMKEFKCKYEIICETIETERTADKAVFNCI